MARKKKYNGLNPITYAMQHYNQDLTEDTPDQGIDFGESDAMAADREARQQAEETRLLYQQYQEEMERQRKQRDEEQKQAQREQFARQSRGTTPYAQNNPTNQDPGANIPVMDSLGKQTYGLVGATADQKSHAQALAGAQSVLNNRNATEDQKNAARKYLESAVPDYTERFPYADAQADVQTTQNVSSAQRQLKEEKDKATQKARTAKNRTQDQEYLYAEDRFNRAAGGENQGAKLLQNVQSYNAQLQQARMTDSTSSLDIMTNPDSYNPDLSKQQHDAAEAARQNIMRQYHLSDNDFDDLAYYAQELSDRDERKNIQDEASARVHTGNKARDVAGGIANSAMALATYPYSGIGAIGGLAQYANRRDKRSPINTNSGAFFATNAASDLQNATQERIQESGARGSKIGSTLYGAGMSALTSAESGVFGGSFAGRAASTAAGLVPFGANAFAQELSDNISNKGQTADKALVNSLVGAGIEVGTEIFSMDKFWDMAKKSSKTARKAVVDYLVSSGIEGSEEVVGDIADNIADALINGDQSEYNQNVRNYMQQGADESTARKQAFSDMLNDTIQSGITGALSGAMGAGLATGVNRANQLQQGQNYFGDYSSQDLRDFADSIETDESKFKSRSAYESAQDARNRALSYADEMDKGRTVSRSGLADLYANMNDFMSTEQEAENQAQQKTDRRFQREQRQQNRVQQDAQNFRAPSDFSQERQQQTQGNLSEEVSTSTQNVQNEAKQPSLEDVYKPMSRAKSMDDLVSIMQSAEDTGNQEFIKSIQPSYEMFRSRMASNENLSDQQIEDMENTPHTVQRAYQAGLNQDLSEDQVQNMPTRLQQSYMDGVIASKKQDSFPASKAALKDIKFTQIGANAQVETKNGTMDFGDVHTSSKATNGLLLFAASQGSTTTANAILDNVPENIPAKSYQRVADYMITQGASGVRTFQQAYDGLSKEGLGAAQQLMNKGAMQNLFDAGVQETQDMKDVSMSKLFKKGSGKVSYNISNQSKAAEAQSYDALYKAVAERTGLDIIVDDSLQDEVNGAFKRNASEVILNPNADDQFGALVHESIGEFSEAWNPEGMKDVQNAVINWWLEDGGARRLSRRGRSTQSDYMNSGVQGEEAKTFRDALNEDVNTALADLFTSEKGQQEFADYMMRTQGEKETRNVFQKIGDWLKNLADSIRNMISNSSPRDRGLLRQEEQQAEKLRQQVFSVLDTAIENYQNAQAQTGTVEDEKAYSISSQEKKDLDDRIEDVLAGTFPEENMVYLRQTPSILSEKIGLQSLPMVMNAAYVYSDIVTQEKAEADGRRKKINYHGLGKQGFIKAVDNLESPLAILKSRNEDSNHDIVALTNTVNESGAPVVAAIKLGKTADVFGVRTLVNDVASIYGKNNNFDDFIEKAFEQGRILYVDKEKSRRNETPGLQLPDRIISSDFTNNLNHYRALVNGNAASDAETIRYSLVKNAKRVDELTGENPQEQTKDLIAVNNCYESALIENLKLGGFASPSVAIIRDSMQHKRFGDISIVFNKDTIDPRNSRNKVYGGDTYTPTFPGVEYDVNTDLYYQTANRLSKSMEGKSPQYLIEEMRRFNHTESGGPDSRGMQGVVDAAKNNYGMKAAYLNSKGITVEDNAAKEEVGKYRNDEAERFDAMRPVLTKFQDEYLKDRKGLSVKDLWAKYRDRLQEAWSAYADTLTDETQKKKWNNYASLCEKKRFRIFNALAWVQNAYDYYQNGNPTHIETNRDEESIRRSINDQINEKDYEDWVRDTYDGLIRGMGIPNGKDYLTASGYRKSFKQLHYPYNLENVEKAKEQQAATGEGGSGWSKFYSAAVARYNTIEDAHADENRLSTLSEEEYKAMEKDLEDRLYEIARKINPDYYEYGAELIADALSKRSTASGVENYLRREAKVYDGVGDDILTLAHRVRELPTNYFEAKPHRIVGFNEIVQAIIPDNSSKELKTLLDERQIPYTTYEAGNEEARHEAIANLQGIRFSIRRTSREHLNDVRHSVGLDDFGDDFWNRAEENYYSSQMDQENETYGGSPELSEILKSGSDELKGSDVDMDAVRRIARRMKSQYGSRINTNELADNLGKLFNYAQGKDYVNYGDLMTTISEVAEPIIDESTQKTGEEEYKKFKDTLGGYTFALTDRQAKEVESAFGNWQNFRRAVPGVKFTREAPNARNGSVSLDSVWSELCDATDNVLDLDATEGDMPLMIADALHSLEPTTQNTYGEYQEQAAKDAAMQIVAEYYQYEGDKQNSAKLKEAASKMNDQLKNYRQQVRDRYQKRYQDELQKIRNSNSSKRNAEKIAALKAKNTRTVQDIRENQKRRDQLRQLNKTGNKMIEAFMDPTEKNHVPTRLQEPVMELLTLTDFIQPTIHKTADGKYSARILQDRTDLGGGRYSYQFQTITGDTMNGVLAQYKESLKRGMGSDYQKKWQDKMQAVKNLYDQQMSGNTAGEDYRTDELIQGLDGDLAADLQKILNSHKSTAPIAELNSDELKTLNKVYKNIWQSIHNIDKLYGLPNQHVSEAAHNVLEHRDQVSGRKQHSEIANGIIDFLTLDNATPETYFHGLGKGGEVITKDLMNANIVKAGDIRTAQEYMVGEDGVQKGKFTGGILEGMSSKDLAKWSGDSAEVHHFKKIDLTTGQIMSLYELMKREDTRSHRAGGFKASVQKVKGKQVMQSTPSLLTDADLKEIVGTLTPKQIEIADKMQHFLANDCSEWGNETSERMFGYQKFLDPTYFPMAVDKNTTRLNNDNSGQAMINSIRNSGFTKSVIPGANNPLVIGDIFDVFSQHVSDMATYHAYAGTISDVIRWYNYNEKSDTKVDEQKFQQNNTVKQAIEDVYGKKGGKYLEKLVRDLNGRETSSYIDGGVGKLIGNYKAAATMGNVRVVLQQPTAWFRAGEMIDYKYLNQGLMPNKAADKMCQDTNSLFWIKNQGNVDGYITSSMKRTITGYSTPKETITNITGIPASKADEVTWAAMYRAVYAEQKDKSGLSVTDPKFQDRVNDRFNEVMLRTQVYDGTLTRSQFMRSGDKMNNIQSAFMAEPTKTYNIILRDVMDFAQNKNNPEARKNIQKHMLRTAGVLLLNSLANAAAQSFWDAFRHAGNDDDKDKNFMQRFAESYGIPVGDAWSPENGFTDEASYFLGGNFADNVDLVNNIPIFKSLAEPVESGLKRILLGEKQQYSSSDSMDTAAVNQFIKALTNTFARSDSSKITNYGVAMQYINAISQFSGIPAYSITRDSVAVYNTIQSMLKGENGDYLQTYGNTSYGKQQLLNAITPVEKTIDAGQDPTKAMQDAVGKGYTSKKIADQLTKDYKQKYIDIALSDPDKAAKMADNLQKAYEAAVSLNDPNDPDHAAKVPDFKSWVKNSSGSKDSKQAIWDSVETGSDYQKAINDALKYGNTYGGIEQSLTDQYKDKFLQAYKNRSSDYATMKNRLDAMYDYLDKMEIKEGTQKKPSKTKRTDQWITESKKKK